jgi:hypothetical protein
VTSRTLVQYFGCDVVWRPTDGTATICGVIQLSGEPEIPQLNLHVPRQEQIPQLQVPVDHVVGVHVPCRINQLQHVIRRFRLR